MRYIEEYRQQDLAAHIAGNIAQAVDPARHYRFMEFCGGHTHAIFRYGIQDLMPANVEYVHGPGCPVCVLPIARLDQAIQLVRAQDVILCSYGDLLRVPASDRTSLLTVKAEGRDVRMVYSTLDALQIARDNPQREVVFLAIGFETTTPPTAVAIRQAATEQLSNFSVLCNHVLTPAAIRAILAAPVADQQPLPLDGFLGPSHVSSIIGSAPYQFVAQQHHKPVVIAGFEPLDVMQSTLMLIRQVNEGRAEVENEYERVVTAQGNQKAQQLVADVFELRDQFEWRGLGFMANSALQIRPHYRAFDAELKFALADYINPHSSDHKACACPDILRGLKKPTDCRLFGKACTPASPMGSCMVSSEGACAAYWSYGRFRQPTTASPASEECRA
ncbi:hydrogenase formation protein HypD [Halioxenophilus sp. WMMB6]|uniref:hydrogenase formation protein HypD n=1 Tax=Halioxenophilus sp. WMMB6 TaxID=3073815 RepID=UPI00295EFEA6|nr:hydrogenase formation protein HypD [Halioxenophilus sp. WMMB6]